VGKDHGAAARDWIWRSAGLTRILPSRDRWIVVVQNGARTAAWATGHSQTAATAVITAPSIRPVRAASPRVWATHELLTLTELRPALSAAGITIGPPAGQLRTAADFGADRPPWG
jgi:hypothetical protein